MDKAVEYTQHFASNFWRNITGVFDEMDNKRWIRLVAAVGAYLLLRPYLMKLGEKLQNKQYEKMMGAAQTGPKAKISPNELRGQVGHVEEEEEVEEVKGVEAGKKARKRQQKKASQQQEDEDASHADLMDQLVDYVEGEDGW
jgi:hypothetical protein